MAQAVIPESPELAGARAWIQQGRYDRAETALRRHLASEPDDGEGHALLALSLVNLDRSREALPVANEALRLDPGTPLAHLAAGFALLNTGDSDGALQHARTAIEIDPSSSEARRLVASAEFNKRRWKESLAAADEGLALDPDDTALQTLRATVLTMLGDRSGAATAIEGTLRRDPENPAAHVAQGYAQLHRGDASGAMESYREALRLDPRNEEARVGIVEAMKGRNPIYAVFLRWFLWTARLGTKATIALFLGYFVLQRLSRSLAQNPDTAMIGWVALAALIGFAWLTYASAPLFNVVLLLDPLGQHALSADERREAIIISTLVLFGAVSLVLSLSGDLAKVLAITLLGLVIPIHVAFSVRGTWQRGIPTVIAGLMVVLGLAAATRIVTGDADGIILALVVIALAAVTTWIAVPLSLRSRRG